MDTVHEALFRAMFASDWYDQVVTTGSDGTGEVFGAISMVGRLTAEHRETVDAYGGLQDPSDLAGHWFVRMNSDGLVFVSKEHSAGAVARLMTDVEAAI
jgi:hypothetical protein